jgi:hypothetical protein
MGWQGAKNSLPSTEHLAVEPIEIRRNLFFYRSHRLCFKHLYTLSYESHLRPSSRFFFALPEHNFSSHHIAPNVLNFMLIYKYYLEEYGLRQSLLSYFL